MKLKLKPYQRDTVGFGLQNQYSIFGLEMGLGKSLCALACWENIMPQRTVIVCPAYLLDNWANEIRKCVSLPVNISVLRTQKDIKSDFLSSRDTHFQIISYNMAQKAEHLFEAKPMLIIDEAHNLSSMKAKRTEYLHRVIYENSIPQVYLLTGTPIKNRVQEFYSLIAICNYNPAKQGVGSDFLDQFPDEISFADHFSNRIEYDLDIGFKRVRIVKFEGVKRPSELKAFLKDIYIRYRAKDVLDLEPVIAKDVLISNTPDPKLLAEFNSHFEDTERSVAPEYKATAALKKVPFTAQYVRGLQGEGVDVVAVYTDHVAAARALAKEFDTEAITGEMPTAKRMRMGDDFQAGKLPVLVATMGAFSTGVNLTRCRNLVLNDYAWTPATIAQTVARIQRIGQSGQCTVHRILGSPTDEYILSTLEKKTETIAEVT